MRALINKNSVFSTTIFYKYVNLNILQIAKNHKIAKNLTTNKAREKN